MKKENVNEEIKRIDNEINDLLLQYKKKEKLKVSLNLADSNDVNNKHLSKLDT